MYGLNIDLLNPAGRPSPDELRALGVRTVRFTYKDASGGDQPDPGRVGYYGNIGRAYAEAGIKSLIILTNESYPGFPNVFPAKDTVWDAYITPFVRRARQLAQAFGPWQPALQVWNEPDLPPSPGYIPTMTEQQYARLLRKTHDAIKAANPTLKVVAAGLASGQPWWLKNVIQAGGGTLPADAVAIHPYEQQPERNWPSADYGFGYVGDLLNRYRQVTNLPLTITECGERLLGDEGQAGYLRRFYNTMLTDFAGVVDDVYWFCYSDGMVPPFGLLTAAGQQKPAYAAYQAVASQPPPPPAGLADTIVTRLTTNQSSIIEGSKVTFEATVQNIGESVTGDTVGVAFLIDGQYITFATTNPLGPGERKTLRSVSPWTATAGDHTLTAVVDDINRYPEASEDNNSLNLAVRVRPAQPTLSDVLVRDITFAEDGAGRVRLAASIANEGGSPTGDIVGVAFFVDDRYVTFGTTPPIDPGQAVTVQAVQLLRLTGSHKITALVDDVNRFPEQNEQNNSRTEQISFGDDPPALADTTVASVSAGRGRLSGGDQVTFEAVVQNIGGGTTGDSVGVAFLVDGQYLWQYRPHPGRRVPARAGGFGLAGHAG